MDRNPYRRRSSSVRVFFRLTTEMSGPAWSQGVSRALRAAARMLAASIDDEDGRNRQFVLSRSLRRIKANALRLQILQRSAFDMPGDTEGLCGLK